MSPYAIRQTPRGPEFVPSVVAALGPGEVRVEMASVGLCRTDVRVARGSVPAPEGLILGHEGAGFVVGSRDPAHPDGALVVIDPFVTCGVCEDCREGSPRYTCRSARFRGVDTDGLFASEVVVSGGALVTLPSELDPRRAAFLEPLAAALALAELPLRPGDSVRVLGTGRHAELSARILRWAHSVTLQDTDDARPSDVVVETRAEWRADEALRRLRYGGTWILRSRPLDSAPSSWSALQRRNVRVFMAHYASFARAAELLASPPFPIDDLLGPALAPLEFLAHLRGDVADESQKVFLDARALRGACAA